MATQALPRRSILAACFLGMLTLSFTVNLPALCLTAIAAEFHLNKAASGFFLSCEFWGLLAPMLLAGPLADRWGIRRPLVFSAVCQAAGFLIAALAAGKILLFLGALILGAGIGVADALFTPLVCAIYPEIRTRMSNLLHAFYPIGILIIVMLSLILFYFHWTWRNIYMLMALAALPYGLAFLVLPLPDRLHLGSDRLSTMDLIRTGPFLLLAGGMFLAAITELGPGQWLPAYVEEATGGSRVSGAIGLLVFGMTMAAGRLLNTWLAHHVTRRQFFAVGGTIAAVSLFLAALPGPTVFTVACLAVLGLGIAGFWPTILAAAGDRFPRAGASMYSLLSAAGNLGGVTGPPLIGLVAEAWGLRAGMAVLTLAPVLAVVIFLGLLRLPENPPGSGKVSKSFWSSA